MVNMEYPYSRNPTPEDPKRTLRETMLAQLEESDRCLKEAARILAPLEREASLALAKDRARREESARVAALAADSKIAAGILWLRIVCARCRSWCFGGKNLHSSTNETSPSVGATGKPNE
jgi:hypothetical protein